MFHNKDKIVVIIVIIVIQNVATAELKPFYLDSDLTVHCCQTTYVVFSV